MIWYNKHLESRFNRIKEEALKRGHTEEDLQVLFLNKLNKKTKSVRIRKMIELAYYLGQLRAIKDVNEGYTPITIDPLEIPQPYTPNPNKSEDE